MRCACFLLALVVTFAAMAEEVDYSTWFQFKGDGVNGLNAVNWYDPTDESQTLVAPTSEHDYYVPADKKLFATTTSTFAGRTLAVAGKIHGCNYGVTHTINKLRMLDQSEITYSTHMSYAGNFEIFGTASIIPFLYNSNAYNFNVNFKSDASAQLNLRTTGNPANAKNKQNDWGSMVASPANIKGDFSEFLGNFNLGPHICVWPTTAATNFSGKVTINTNTIWYIDDKSRAYTFGSLDLKRGSVIYRISDVNGIFSELNVTNQLSIEAGAVLKFSTQIKVNLDTYFKMLSRGLKLFHLTGPATNSIPSAEALAGVVVSNLVPKALFTQYVYPRESEIGLAVSTNADGSVDIFYGDTTGAAVMNVANSSNGSTAPVSFRDGSCWLSGKVPDQDFSGYAIAPVSSLSTPAGNNAFSFTNMTLYVPHKCCLYHHSASLTFKRLVLTAGNSVWTYAGSWNPTFYGEMEILADSDEYVSFKTGTKDCFHINSTIFGEGNLGLGLDGDDRYAADLRGTNSNFHGSWQLIGNKSKQWDSGATPPVDNCTMLTIYNGTALGGPFNGLSSWWSVKVGNYAKLIAADDAIITEPTRNVYIPDEARFIVNEGKVMSFAGDIVYEGTLTKQGAGRLGLGAAKFSASGAEPTYEAVAGKNVLLVDEGSVSVNSTNSLNGVAVTFAAGTKLAVDPSVTDAGLLQYGAVMTRSGSALTYADTKLQVEFCNSLDTGISEKAVAICTVPSSLDATLQQLEVPSKIHGFKVTTTTRTNADGSITLVANFIRQGLYLFLQ